MRFLRQYHHVGVLLLFVLVNRYPRAALGFQALQLLAVAVHFVQAGSDDRSLIPDYPAQYHDQQRGEQEYPAQCAQEGISDYARQLVVLFTDSGADALRA